MAELSKSIYLAGELVPSVPITTVLYFLALYSIWSKDISPSFLLGQVMLESELNPLAYNQVSRATGLAQFASVTWQDYGCNYDRYNEISSIAAQIKYMHDLYYKYGDLEAAYCSYTQGPLSYEKRGCKEWVGDKFATLQSETTITETAIITAQKIFCGELDRLGNPDNRWVNCKDGFIIPTRANDQNQERRSIPNSFNLPRDTLLVPTSRNGVRFINEGIFDSRQSRLRKDDSSSALSFLFRGIWKATARFDSSAKCSCGPMAKGDK